MFATAEARLYAALVVAVGVNHWTLLGALGTMPFHFFSFESENALRESERTRKLSGVHTDWRICTCLCVCVSVYGSSQPRRTFAFSQFGVCPSSRSIKQAPGYFTAVLAKRIPAARADETKEVTTPLVRDDIYETASCPLDPPERAPPVRQTLSYSRKDRPTPVRGLVRRACDANVNLSGK